MAAGAPEVPQAGEARSGTPLPLRRVVAAAAMVAALAGVLLAGLASGAPAAALFLVFCALCGAALTQLSGLPLVLEERLFMGAVIGPIAITLAGLLAGLRFGFGAGVTVAGVIAGVALAAIAWGLAGGSLMDEARDALKRWTGPLDGPGHPWPLLAVLLVCWTYTLRLLSVAYRTLPDGTLHAGNPGSYADWAAHLTYAGSFAFGQNFPPEFPIDPGHAFGYAFGIDYLAAMLVPLGSSLPVALVLSSGLLGLALPGVIYLCGLRLVHSRLAAALAVFVFVLSGGLGFLDLAANVRRGGLAVLTRLPRLYTQDVEHNFQWLNPVLAWLFPQRSVLFGLTVALIVLTILWIAIHRLDRGGPRWSPFLFAGVVTGLTPIFHVYGYGTAVAMAAFWALLVRRREWVAFFVPALVLGLPVVRWMSPEGGLAIRQQLGWLAASGGHHDPFLWFWIKNTSALLPLMLVAFAWRGLVPGRLAMFLAPIWLWFLVPNIVVLQPWDWDNTKYFAFWLLFGGLMVAALLARVARAGAAGVAVAALLFAGLSLSGTLDLARTLDPDLSGAGFMDARGQSLAEWARTSTAPRSIFLVAPDHNSPIPVLGGRRVMVGYRGWIWTYGLSDGDRRYADEQVILQGGLATESLLRAYDISYVVIGPRELAAPLSASRAWFEAHATRVYQDPEYTVYRV